MQTGRLFGEWTIGLSIEWTELESIPNYYKNRTFKY